MAFARRREGWRTQDAIRCAEFHGNRSSLQGCAIPTKDRAGFHIHPHHPSFRGRWSEGTPWKGKPYGRSRVLERKGEEGGKRDGLGCVSFVLETACAGA